MTQCPADRITPTRTVSGANTYLRSDGQVAQAAAARSPTVIVKVSGTTGIMVRPGVGKATAGPLMYAFSMVVVLETEQFPLRISGIPEWRVVEILAPECPDEALDERASDEDAVSWKVLIHRNSHPTGRIRAKCAAAGRRWKHSKTENKSGRR